ncbi:MAG TPA: methyltransferase domain-containing protein, partial [Bacillota bacterium]|nr:methyltransferase domain-containing protein [Bacillota bacterium]
ERVSFFYKFLKSPKRVGSITPSSTFLANAMLRHVDWRNTNSIVELGAGTGVFTRHINRKKKDSCVGIIYEQDVEMQRRLKVSYPHFNFCTTAETIQRDLENLNINGVDCVISGLPFANFDQSLRNRIMDGVVRSLKPGGSFIAFQYSKQMMDQLEDIFTYVDLSFVPFNFPPAFVYHCKK